MSLAFLNEPIGHLLDDALKLLFMLLVVRGTFRLFFALGKSPLGEGDALPHIAPQEILIQNRIPHLVFYLTYLLIELLNFCA